MVATEVIIPTEIFNFSSQAKVDTFAIDLDSLLAEQRAYNEVIVNKYRLSLEAIRKHADDFTYWQRRKGTGWPPVHERNLMIAFLVRSCSMPRSGRPKVSWYCWPKSSTWKIF